MLLLGIALLLVARRLNPAMTDVLNAPTNVANLTLLVGLLGTLVTGALFVEAGHRDVRWRMEPLFHSAPLRGWEYLGGRFLAELLLNALLLLAVPLGLLLGTQLPAVSPDVLGPFRLEAYLLPYVVLLLPALLVNAALLFSITVLSRRSLPGYLAALALLVGSMVSLNEAGTRGPAPWALLDPTGGLALNALMRGWPRVDLNTRLVGLDGVLLWNRLLWTTLAAAMLVFTYRRYRLAHAEPTSRRRAREADAVAEQAARLDPRGQVTLASPAAVASAAPVAALAPTASPRSTSGGILHVRQTLAVARLAVRQTVLGREFPLVTLGLVALALSMVVERLHDPLFGTPLRPLTGIVAGTLAGVGGLIVLPGVFYAGELVWRQRDAGIHELTDAQPVPDWVFLVGNFLALALLFAVLQAVLMAAGLVLQAMEGFHAIRPGLYLEVLFGVLFASLLPFAVLALLVHVLVNQKYLGHLAAVLVLLAMGRLGLEHNLLIFGSGPGMPYSDLNGFGGSVASFVWFKLYWAGWALLLGVVALLFVIRGPESWLRSRLRRARQRCTRRLALASAAAALLVLTTGGFIFYNTNVLHDYRTAWDAGELHAEYERRYKRFEHAAQPWLTGMRLNAEIYPERREVAVLATYRLVNRTRQPIDSIHLSSWLSQDITLRGIRFDRPARRVLEDSEHGYRIYALRRPLQPGDSLLLNFRIDVARRGFRSRERPSVNGVVVGDFTHLMSPLLLPGIGYQREFGELSDAGDRRAHDLPRADIRPPIDDPRALRQPLVSPDADWIDFEGTVGTAGDQVAVLPGTLQRTWAAGKRRYFHYRAETRIPAFFGLLSGRYAIYRARWRDVDIRVLHDPAHAFNLERMAADVRASLDYLIEFPGYGNFARSYPGQLVYSENHPIAIARPYEEGTDRVDTPLLVTAHELAHQWWGKELLGADVQGAQALSETLAQYSAAMVLERNRGAAVARRLLWSMHMAYLEGRGSHRTPEVPLLLTTDHEYIHYRKGPVVMYALRDYVGEDRVNAALRGLLRKHARRGPPYATALDLYDELQAVTPDSLQSLLHDLFATITLWDLRTTAARARPLGDGRYSVTLTVNAARLRSDSVGNDTPLPMDDPVDVAVFGEASAKRQLGRPLYLRKHRIHSGSQTITVVVSGKPGRAGIDPYHKLIARHVDALMKLDLQVPAVEISAPADPGRT